MSATILVFNDSINGWGRNLNINGGLFLQTKAPSHDSRDGFVLKEHLRE